LGDGELLGVYAAGDDDRGVRFGGVDGHLDRIIWVDDHGLSVRIHRLCVGDTERCDTQPDHGGEDWRDAVGPAEVGSRHGVLQVVVVGGGRHGTGIRCVGTALSQEQIDAAVA
ncbi:MAG: hypothetical protein ABW195_02625, partial [Ilumatobacteraceae bacterium]